MQSSNNMIQSSNLMIHSLLDFFQRNPRDFTYFAVGSSPRILDVEKLTPELDQIFPTFLRDYITSKDDTIRVVHYDPVFNQEAVINFLHQYFKSLSSLTLDFKYDDQDGILHWFTTDYRIEVFVLGQSFDIPNEIENIKSMITHHLNTKTKLVFQEYYGLSNGANSLVHMHKEFYQSISPEHKELYKQNILFDITYGEAHCMTDMLNEKPMLDDFGNFINLCILTFEEKNELIGINERFDNIYKKENIKKFMNLIDYGHLNYRRSVNEKASEDDSGAIMTSMHLKMKTIIYFLKKLNVLNDEDDDQINELFVNYKKIDMYNWPSSIKNIIRKKIE